MVDNQEQPLLSHTMHHTKYSETRMILYYVSRCLFTDGSACELSEGSLTGY